MKKLAVFVEGQTEQIFIKRLIEEVAGANNVILSIQSVSTNKIVSLSGQSATDDKAKYFVLIYDCQCDKKVKSSILDNRERLSKAGYSSIFGLFDLYPAPLSDLPRVQLSLYKYIPTAGIEIKLYLAIAEIEAWFLQDASHYQKISPQLTADRVRDISGFDPQVDSAESLPEPAKTLKSIYNSAGRGYDKSRAHVQRTVDALDIELLCITASPLIPSFASLYGDLDTFLG